MTSDFPVILDACVLFQAAVRDTLLRLSEQRLFLCRWSDDIIQEVVRTLTSKLNVSAEKARRLVSEMEENFPDAYVPKGYQVLIPSMTNHEKDRHVLAAAVKGGCELIVTYNQRHFPAESLSPLDLYTRTPDNFLMDLYQYSPEKVVHVLHEQGADLNPPRTLQEVLVSLETCQCHGFAKLVREQLLP